MIVSDLQTFSLDPCAERMTLSANQRKFFAFLCLSVLILSDQHVAVSAITIVWSYARVPIRNPVDARRNKILADSQYSLLVGGRFQSHGTTRTPLKFSFRT
jgi:hypothetical protein